MKAEPEDLSGNLIVQLGTVTEQLNRHWYERNTGRVFHPVKRWMAATLDGIVEGSGAQVISPKLAGIYPPIQIQDEFEAN